MIRAVIIAIEHPENGTYLYPAGVYRARLSGILIRLPNNISCLIKPFPGPTSSNDTQTDLTLLYQVMSGQQPKPQFQHYVPRFLLRRWATVKTVTKR